MKRGSHVRGREGMLYVVQDAGDDCYYGAMLLVQEVGVRNGRHGWFTSDNFTPVPLQEAWDEINARRETGEWG